jgi:hypothetical protein
MLILIIKYLIKENSFEINKKKIINYDKIKLFNHDEKKYF